MLGKTHAQINFGFKGQSSSPVQWSSPPITNSRPYGSIFEPKQSWARVCSFCTTEQNCSFERPHALGTENADPSELSSHFSYYPSQYNTFYTHNSGLAHGIRLKALRICQSSDFRQPFSSLMTSRKFQRNVYDVSICTCLHCACTYVAALNTLRTMGRYIGPMNN